MTDDPVEVMARAMWSARALHFGEPVAAVVDDERMELCRTYARAALSALKKAGYVPLKEET